MATQTLELEPDAFWRMVTEENLKVGGPSAGYQWTGRKGKDGWETFKVRAQPIGWLYQARRVWTSGVGGGAVTIRISVPTGVVAKLIAAEIIGPASAGATMSIFLLDEDGANMTKLAYLAAGATRIVYLPSVGTTAAHDNTPMTLGMMVGPGQYISTVCSASLQNETVKVSITMLMSAEVSPVWDTTGSVSVGALAASTISAPLQAVYL